MGITELTGFSTASRYSKLIMKYIICSIFNKLCNLFWSSPVDQKDLNLSHDAPSPDELLLIRGIIELCKEEIKQLRYPSEDVIGQWRVLRFLRNQNGSLDKATKRFKSFLNHRIKDNHLIEELGHDVRGLAPDEFIKWYDENRNPYLPQCPYGGDSKDELTVYWFNRQGAANYHHLVRERTEENPITEEGYMVIQCHEWMSWYLCEKSKKKNQLCYMRKVMDFKGGHVRPFDLVTVSIMISMGIRMMGLDYCESDDSYVLVDTPTIFNYVLGFIKVFLTEKQRNKFKLATSDTALQYCDKECLPLRLGGLPGKVVDTMLYDKVLTGSDIRMRLKKRYEIRKKFYTDMPKSRSDLTFYEWRVI